MNSIPKSPGSETPLTKFRWPMAVVLVAFLFVGAWVISIKSCARAAPDTVHAVGTEVSNLLKNFDQQHITRTFQESLPQLNSEPGGRLEIAALTLNENLSESNALTTAWGHLDLGSTVTEIKVPAIYRYYVRLHDPWQLEVATNICVVHAPRIHPTLPVAIDTSRMEKKSNVGWGRFNAGDQMDQLEKDLTPTLSLYAADARHIALVREECRKTVAQFIRDWLLKEQQWRDDRFTAVKVVFPDEATTNAFTLPATLELKTQ
ncbi:MAG TPA: hypothetical protein VG754_00895 [Verrucomicrobiae bacterium]|jgi:hypothetical protein|nr:hypothetical protein [Verrucomicrobiae bacterium]